MRISLILLVFIIGCLFQVGACSEGGKQPQTISTDTIPKKKTGLQKPGSSFSDTLHVKEMAAVFYSPDSLQRKKIEEEMDNGVFEATMHEYDNQFRVSHLELKDNWKKVQVLEATRYRFLQFIRQDGKAITIDLDTRGEPCGLYAFDPRKDPQSIDMMNVGTQLYYYFGQ